METLLKEIKESLNGLKVQKEDLANIKQEKESKIEEREVVQKEIQSMQNGDMRKVIKENEFYKINEEINELENSYKDKRETVENDFKEIKEKIKESVSERLNSFKFRADVDKMKKEIEEKKEQKEEQENEIAKLNKKVEELFEKQKKGDASEIWRIQNLQSYIERHYNIRNELKEELEEEEQKLAGYIIFEDNQEEYSVLKNIEEQIEKSTFDNIDKIPLDIDVAQQTVTTQQGKVSRTVQTPPDTQPRQNNTANQTPPDTQPRQNNTANQIPPDTQPRQNNTANQTPPVAQPKQNNTVNQPKPAAQPKQNNTVNQPKPAAQPKQNSIASQISPAPQPVQTSQTAPNTNPVKNQQTKTKQEDIKDSTKFLVSINEQGLLYNYIKDGEVRDEKALGIIECANKILKHKFDDCFLHNFAIKSIKDSDELKDDKTIYDNLIKDIVTYDMAGAENCGFRARRQLRKLVKRFEKAGLKVINKDSVKFNFKTDILKGLSNFFKGSKKGIAGRTQKQALLDRHHDSPNAQGERVSNSNRNENFVTRTYSSQRDEELESEIIQNAIRKAKQKIDNDKKQAKMQNSNNNKNMQR